MIYPGKDQTLRCEYALAFHCSPAIEGIKTSNLISIKKDRYTHLPMLVKRWAEKLRPRGILVRKLYECPCRALLLIYSRSAMEGKLQAASVQTLMRDAGYLDLSEKKVLSRLTQRLRAYEQGVGAYPHEIGVLLDYPVEDVLGFVAQRGKGYQYSGYWKVYGDVEGAKRRFQAYDLVKKFYCSQVSQGREIQEIFLGGNEFEQSTGCVLVGNR